MYYTNKTRPTLAIVVIVTAVTLVTAGNIITASALAVKKHTAASINSISSITKRTSDSLSQFISCIKAVDHEVTLVAADLCW